MPLCRQHPLLQLSEPILSACAMAQEHGDNGDEEHKEQVRRTMLQWDSQIIYDKVCPGLHTCF